MTISNPLPTILTSASFALALALTTLVGSPAARACGATCDVPEFWDLQFTPDGRIAVVTNFGLLHETDGDWYLVCEAAVGGGLITSAELSAAGAFVSTTEGLFLAPDYAEACDYSRLELGAGDDWPLSFAAAGDSADAPHYVLVLDQEADQIHLLERREDDFAAITSLPRAGGFREVIASGDWTYVTGYTFSPRALELAYSQGGEDWELLSFGFGEEFTLLPLDLDPERPTRLMFYAQTPSDEPARLFSFDAETQKLDEVFVPDGTEPIVGYAVAGDYQFVATTQDTAGALYRSPRDSFEFERLDTQLPALSCLRARDDVLYLCGADFTRGTPFTLATSSDDGLSFEPKMGLLDLGFVDGCDNACQPALNWLAATYGSLSAAGIGVDGGAPATGTPGRGEPGQSDTPGSGAEASEEPTQKNQGGCTIATSASAQPWTQVFFGALASLLLLGRRSRRRSVPSYP